MRKEARILDNMLPPTPLFANHRPRFLVWGPAHGNCVQSRKVYLEQELNPTNLEVCHPVH